MRDKKELNRPDNMSEQSRDSEEYNFIKETIKDKPINRKALFTRIAAIAGGAVLFGAIAAVVFAGVLPVAENRWKQKRDTPRVDINVEEPEEAPAVTETVEEKPEETVVPEIIEVPRNITLEDYERIYEEVRQVAEKPLKAMVSVTGVSDEEDILDNSYVQFGRASGVIIAKNRAEIYVLTEVSALGKDAERVQVTFCNEAIAEGVLRKSDSSSGLAVVAVPVENVSEETREEIIAADLGNSYSLMQGKPVIAIGSPSGYNEAVAYGNIISVSNKVSVLDAEYNLLVTDIQGSSEGSGVLLDTSGSVIGIIAQSFGNGSSDTMVKALSVSQLKSLLETLSNGEDIRFAGIYGQDVTESIAGKTGIPQGIYVDSVKPESPAMVAGIQSADVITEFNGKEITTMQKFSNELQKCKNEQKVRLKLMRKGNEGYVEMEFEITIGVI